MKPLSPKDASIMAIAAENPGASFERLTPIIALADDVQEVEAVVRELLNDPTAWISLPTPEVKSTVDALRRWADGNSLESFNQPR